MICRCAARARCTAPPFRQEPGNLFLLQANHVRRARLITRLRNSIRHRTSLPACHVNHPVPPGALQTARLLPVLAGSACARRFLTALQHTGHFSAMRLLSARPKKLLHAWCKHCRARSAAQHASLPEATQCRCLSNTAAVKGLAACLHGITHTRGRRLRLPLPIPTGRLIAPRCCNGTGAPAGWPKLSVGLHRRGQCGCGGTSTDSMVFSGSQPRAHATLITLVVFTVGLAAAASLLAFARSHSSETVCFRKKPRKMRQPKTTHIVHGIRKRRYVLANMHKNEWETQMFPGGSFLICFFVVCFS